MSRRNKPGYETVNKVKKDKVYTRMQAERAIASGTVTPDTFIDMSAAPEAGKPGKGHANYHVRAKAWKKLGCPIPENWSTAEKTNFYASIHYKQSISDNEPADHPT